MSEFLTAVPALPTRDIQAASEFYRSKLGFSVAYQDDSFVSLTQGAVEIHLWLAADESWKTRTSPQPVCSGAESFIAGTASCRIRVTGIDALYAKVRPLQIVHPNGTLEDKPWGDREFAVSDPDGNLVTFFQPL